MVQFQSQNWQAWDPKRACFGLSRKTEKSEVQLKPVWQEVLPPQGRVPLLVPFRSLIGWGPPTWGRAIDLTQATIQIFSSQNTLTYTGNLWPNVWAASCQLPSHWALGWAWFTILSLFLVSEKSVHLLSRPLIPTCAPEPVLSCC